MLPRERGFPNGFLCENNTQGSRCVLMKKKRKKKTALVICRDRKQFWTTQAQFWQWVRDGLLVKQGDHPLTGAFIREHEELMVLFQRTVLNLANRNHMREALYARRVGLAKR